MSSHETDRLLAGDDQVDVPDRFHINWLCCLAIGVGQLFPWVTYVAAADYWTMQFPNFAMLFFLPIIFNWANLGSRFILFRLDKCFSPNLMLNVAYFTGWAMMILVPVVNYTPWNNTLQIGIVLASGFINGFVAGIIKQQGFGLSATLPKRYTNAVMAGQGLSGVVMVSAGFLTDFLVVGDELTRARNEGLFFFSFAALILLICAIMTAYMQTTPFFLAHQKMKTEPFVVVGQEPEEEVSLYKIFKKIWKDALAVFLCFVVTFTLYPAFTTRIPNYWGFLGDRIGPGSKYPIVLVSVYQLFDFVGRMVPNVLFLYFEKLHLFIIGSRFLLFPLWFLFVYTNLIPYNSVVLVMLMLMVTSSGYLGTITMMVAPKRVDSKRRKYAGKIMAFFLQLGVFTGVHLALVILVAIEGLDGVLSSS